ncbi:hypothetical protein FB45DRAFT_1001599 [Roridomyces roridus]|uniref:NACHT domain-containing protein n=1 Tax=Roridomyces roridus TaxID=1738132 RepID=A0AAD7C1E4_9AGAR|nr:hypothetical protein FB45DRAFT_1001599 [Roridomyces roridus]
MPFSLSGIIHDGNFTNVEGDMTQVFNSYVTPGPQQAKDRLGDAHALPAPPGGDWATGSSSRHLAGPIRNGRPTHQDQAFYSRSRAPNSAAIADTQEWSTPHDNRTQTGVAGASPKLARHLLTNNIHDRPDSQARNMFSVQGNMTQVYVTSQGSSGLDVLYRSIAIGAVHDRTPDDPPRDLGPVRVKMAPFGERPGAKLSKNWLCGKPKTGKNRPIFVGISEKMLQSGPFFGSRSGLGSFHDSAERFPEPACHPGTRTVILEDLRAWSQETSPGSRILWLYGAAGMGKCAVAQAFAGECNKESRLGASFFFKRSDFERGTWERFFATLAYQLALSIPRLSGLIQRTIEEDRLLVGRSMERQFHRLILEPLRTCETDSQHVIIIDGLDECEGPKVQETILRLWIEGITFHNLPIRLLITSRPEPHLREIMEASEVQDICLPLQMTADDKAYDDTNSRPFFRARGIHIGPSWPPSGAIDRIVEKSCGAFIYAATVINFISDQYSHPVTQLQSVLNLDPKSTAPLDDLYTQILSALPQDNRTSGILYALWLQDKLYPEQVDLLLGAPEGSSRLLLRPLHCVLDLGTAPIPRGSCGIRFLHTSFWDFLGDARRSKGWSVSHPEIKAAYLEASLDLLSKPAPLPNSRDRDHFLQLVQHFFNQVESDDHTVYRAKFQNPTFQNNFFLPATLYLSRGIPPDSPLNNMLFGRRYIKEFCQDRLWSRGGSPAPGSPPFPYDQIYKTIFTKSPALVIILSCLILLGDRGPAEYEPQLERLIHTFNETYRIFLYFADFRDTFPQYFYSQQSPLDFLSSPDRAGAFYLDRGDLAERLIMLWAQGMKDFINGQNTPVDWKWIRLLQNCHKSAGSPVFSALRGLKLSMACRIAAGDQVQHKQLHDCLMKERQGAKIMTWFNAVPDVSPQQRENIEQFYKAELAAIRRCGEEKTFCVRYLSELADFKSPCTSD